MTKLNEYFENKLSAQEQLEVQMWLAENGYNPDAEAQLEELFDKLHVDDEAAARAAFPTGRQPARHYRRSTKHDRLPLAYRRMEPTNRRNPHRSALVRSLPALRHPSAGSRVVRETGTLRRNRLSDPSRRHALAPQLRRRITYPSAFTGKERRIFVDGEIFADVAKDPHKPFIIRSGDVGIRVLGTKFNFKSYTNTDCIELLLVDGAVQFDIDTDTRKQQLRMEPGDLVLYDRVSNDINLSTFQPEHFKSFADNRAIHFFNLRMHDIALDLERLFGTRIVILDEALAQTRYFAYFTNNETLDQILSAINSDRKMKISRRDGVVYLSLK